MLLETLVSRASRALHALPEQGEGRLGWLGAVGGLVVALLLWRVCRFTVMPRLYPDDPPELPYWIPVLGHGLAFFGNSNALLSRARRHFGNTKEPFALTIAGTKIYVVTKASDVAEAYRHADTLSFNEFVQAMMRVCGNTEACVRAMYRPLARDKDGFANPHGKPLATLARQMHIHQLYPGERLDALERHFLGWFDARLSLPGLRRACPYAVGDADAMVLPLMEWCSDFFTRAGQRAYFGDALEAIDPGLTRTFVVFDELSWQVLYQYPALLAGDMRRARDALQRALKAYIRLPAAQRPGEAWFTTTIEREMRALAIGDDDIATMLVTVYWGINTNTRKGAFWLLAYLLHAPSLIDAVRRKTAAAFGYGGTVDLDHLHHACPLLQAMWNETIRLSAYSASVRFVTRDTLLGGKMLRRGCRLMVPYRQLHFDEAVFGAAVDEFRPQRFLNNASLTQSTNWRPFGGGSTMCPGRYVAKRSVLLFVAMLLRRFDIAMDGHQPIPAADEGKPVLGIMSIKGNQDLRVRLTPRGNVA